MFIMNYKPHGIECSVVFNYSSNMQPCGSRLPRLSSLTDEEGVLYVQVVQYLFSNGHTVCFSSPIQSSMDTAFHVSDRQEEVAR